MESEQPTPNDLPPVSEEASPEVEPVEEEPTDEPLGQPGVQALQREKERRRNAERELRELKKQAAEAPKPDTDLDPEALRKQIEQEVRAEIEESSSLELKQALVTAAAAGRLENPADAALFLDLNDLDLVDRKLNSDDVKDALDALLTERPYLAAQSGPRAMPAPHGVRKGPSEPPQLTKRDLQNMSPQEIQAAREKGQLDNLLT